MAKILIVEDEKAINDLVRFNLELVGHDCYQVFDGEVGLDEALKLKYDLIILDVMLPKYSGFEIMEYIEETPVILLQPNQHRQIRSKAFVWEPMTTLQNPLTLLNLWSALRPFFAGPKRIQKHLSLMIYELSLTIVEYISPV